MEEGIKGNKRMQNQVQIDGISGEIPKMMKKVCFLKDGTSRLELKTCFILKEEIV